MQFESKVILLAVLAVKGKVTSLGSISSCRYFRRKMETDGNRSKFFKVLSKEFTQIFSRFQTDVKQIDPFIRFPTDHKHRDPSVRFAADLKHEEIVYQVPNRF